MARYSGLQVAAAGVGVEAAAAGAAEEVEASEGLAEVALAVAGRVVVGKQLKTALLKFKTLAKLNSINKKRLHFEAAFCIDSVLTLFAKTLFNIILYFCTFSC